MSLGSRINQQRAAHGLSQVDLADLLEVSRQSVSKWETDGSVPDLDKLVKMCEVFQVSLDWLVLGKTPAAPPAAPQPASLQLPALTREMIGGALAGLGLLALIVMAAAQTILSGVLLALPFLACGGAVLPHQAEAAPAFGVRLDPVVQPVLRHPVLCPFRQRPHLHLFYSAERYPEQRLLLPAVRLGFPGADRLGRALHLYLCL